jgi:pimeloyl-ACP methyl ester carboxylesterase
MNPWLLSAFLALSAVYVGLVLFARATTRKVERLVPPQGDFVDVDGVRLHYVERGSGPVTLLLVHGLAGNVRHFTYRLLDTLARDHHVIAIDRPGSGYSAHLPTDAGPQAQAALLAAFIDARGLDRPVIVGHSLGGAVALALALQHPARARALALLAPLTQVPPAVPDVFAALAIPNAVVRWVVGWTLAVPLSIARRDTVLRVVFGPDPVPGDFAIAGGGLLGVRPVTFISAAADLMAVPRDLQEMSAQYPQLTVPVSVLYGTKDRVLSPTLHAEGLRAQLPAVQLEWVDGAGHMLPLTAPEHVAAFVRGVVARSADPRPA